ncbi:SurA N-terminal domain-containing protein [Utexia brackfieldae]|uniref:SurA N-terminal domain-containing protein n=1 Tax=Utexia brackfieldae TaxID=3074108 RepID=UPI00370CFEB9
MMEKIRSAANNIVVKVIFGLIMLSFIFAGAGGLFSAGNNDPEFIVKVDGKGLNRIQYENAVRDELQKNNLSSENPGSPIVTAVRQNVLNQQIDGYLRDKFIDDLHITISNDQIKNIIRQHPMFAENGRFSSQRYAEFLQQQGITSDMYAEYIRNLLKQQQAFGGLLYSDFVLPAETDIMNLKDQTRTFSAAPVSFKDLGIENKTFSDDEAYAYYQLHPELFTANVDLVKLNVLRLPTSTLLSSINPSNTEIKAYYEKHQQTYAQPAQFAYSSIETDSLEQANTIYQSLIDGANFAQLASEKGLYPLQRQNKGTIGWFSADEVPVLIKQANLIKVGQFSKPIAQTNGHYVIVRLDDIRPEKIPALDSIVAQVKADMIQSLADERLHHAEDQLTQYISEGLSLSDIAQKMNLSSEQTNWVSNNMAPLTFSAVGEAVMQQLEQGSNNLDTIMGPIYVDDNASLYVIQITDHRPAGLASFDSVKGDILVSLQNQDRQQRFQNAVNMLVTQLNSGDAAAKAKVHFAAPQTITRNDQAIQAEVVSSVFNLIPSLDNKPVYGIAYLPDNTAEIISLNGIGSQSVQSSADENRQVLLSQLLSTSSQGMMGTLKDAAKIEVMSNSGL